MDTNENFSASIVTKPLKFVLGIPEHILKAQAELDKENRKPASLIIR